MHTKGSFRTWDKIILFLRYEASVLKKSGAFLIWGIFLLQEHRGHREENSVNRYVYRHECTEMVNRKMKGHREDLFFPSVPFIYNTDLPTVIF